MKQCLRCRNFLPTTEKTVTPKCTCPPELPPKVVEDISKTGEDADPEESSGAPTGPVLNG